MRVTRIVNAVAAGRIINPKTARSQIMGGVVMGHRHGARTRRRCIDHRLGRFMNHNFAEYHVPVNADIHDIDVIFVDRARRQSSTRSASRASARSASSAPRRPSPTRSFTRPASASASCRSRSTSFFEALSRQARSPLGASRGLSCARRLDASRRRAQASRSGTTLAHCRALAFEHVRMIFSRPVRHYRAMHLHAAGSFIRATALGLALLWLSGSAQAQVQGRASEAPICRSWPTASSA